MGLRMLSHALCSKFRTSLGSHSHDNTPHIPAGLFGNSGLDMGDLASDECFARLLSENLLEEHDRKFDGDSSLRFLEVIKLTKILGKVLEDG
jgi:hypothetical protein